MQILILTWHRSSTLACKRPRRPTARTTSPKWRCGHMRCQSLVSEPDAAPRLRSDEKVTPVRPACPSVAPGLLVENRLVERLAIVGLPIHDELILVHELDWHRLAVHDDDAAVQVLGGRCACDRQSDELLVQELVIAPRAELVVRATTRRTRRPRRR